MSRLCTLLIFSLALQAAGVAQRYEYVPFYQNGPAAPPNAHRAWKTNANGVTATISLLMPPYGPINEGMKVDGSFGKNIIHLYVEDGRHRVSFAFDLLLEPIADTTKVRCTFRPFTASVWPLPRPFDESLATPAWPEHSDPLIIEDGETISVSMIPDSDGAYRMIQYIQVELHAKATSPSAANH